MLIAVRLFFALGGLVCVLLITKPQLFHFVAVPGVALPQAVPAHAAPVECKQVEPAAQTCPVCQPQGKCGMEKLPHVSHPRPSLCFLRLLLVPLHC